MAKQHWMAAAFAKNKGALHKELGVSAGKPIPVAKLMAAGKRAKKTGDTTLARRVNLAEAARTISNRSK